MARRGQRAEKAYKNLKFLNSPDARVVRILSEYMEPLARLRRHGVADTIVFFGSARLRPSSEVRKDLEGARCSPDRGRQSQVAKLARELTMARYYDDAVELARLMTEWSKGLEGGSRRFVICSGGAGGIRVTCRE